ncbi:MAG: serine hydrolase [Flavobacteriaceae bacterium]|nr:serine hydrolase [Flavobacteriaceae bacterium]|tara:strand:- start:142116 stop:143195 length:1080 start_codon:yes stop_codon:yes gene_type:complete
MRSITVIFVLILCWSCGSTETESVDPPSNTIEFYYPPNNSNSWDHLDINSLGWNTATLNDLETFLSNSGTEAFMILKDGRIVMETYYNGSTANDPHPWFSAGKTLTAFTMGLAQQDGFLTIADKVKDYLGSGWTTMPNGKEDLISIKNLLTMTSGGDYRNVDLNCTDPSCLEYFADAGNSWYYHNAFYTLLQPILDAAIPQGFDSYFNQQLRSKIGMSGLWIRSGFNRFYVSNARAMARFGILNLTRGNWNGEQLLDESYFNEMTTTSQNLNQSYGYLWWLNGKSSKRLPGSPLEFQGQLIEQAPTDLIAGMGANDQKLYVIPSENLVIIRLGEDGRTSNLGPSTYDNQLWEKLNTLMY